MMRRLHIFFGVLNRKRPCRMSLGSWGDVGVMTINPPVIIVLLVKGVHPSRCDARNDGHEDCC